VRSEHLWEAGRRVRLRTHIPHLVDFLAKGIDGFKFSFYVISAAPREVILSALEGIVPPITSSAPSSTTSRTRRGAFESRACRRGTARWPPSSGWNPSSISTRIARIYVGDGSSTCT
jgi:hypothetical protein